MRPPPGLRLFTTQRSGADLAAATALTILDFNVNEVRVGSSAVDRHHNVADELRGIDGLTGRSAEAVFTITSAGAGFKMT